MGREPGWREDSRRPGSAISCRDRHQPRDHAVGGRRGRYPSVAFRGIAEELRGYVPGFDQRDEVAVRRTGMSILILAIIGVSVILIVAEVRREEVPGPTVPATWPGGRPSSTSAGAERITGYVGAAACRECHPGESALYARSGHRRTLWPATTDQNPVVAWLDGKTGRRTRKSRKSPGRITSRTADWSPVIRTVGGRTESVPLDYGFGSGKHGVTFVGSGPVIFPGLGPAGLEHRLVVLRRRPLGR